MKDVVYDSICGNGSYWCQHVFDDQFPWVWVDFRFPSIKKPKSLYFACAMRTLEYTRIQEIEDELYDKAVHEIKDHPPFLNLMDEKYWQDLKKIRDEVNAKVATDTAFMRPSITIQKYGPGRIGVHCTVNTPYINDKVIREFIDHFRSLGEPTADGYTWYGEEVKVETRNLISNEYGKRPL